jgi:anti-sigma-K factor RskA
VVEARGRTGRKPTAAEKAGTGAGAGRARESRLERSNRPPTWRGAFVRAMAAAALFALASLLLFKKSAPVALFPIVLLMYLPISYYTDLWMYRRRQRNRAGRTGGKAASR